jgi:hypothetical protein
MNDRRIRGEEIREHLRDELEVIGFRQLRPQRIKAS